MGCCCCKPRRSKTSKKLIPTDYKGKAQSAAIMEVKSKSDLTFEVDRIMERIAEAEEAEDKRYVNSPPYDIPYKKGEGNGKEKKHFWRVQIRYDLLGEGNFVSCYFKSVSGGDVRAKVDFQVAKEPKKSFSKEFGRGLRAWGYPQFLDKANLPKLVTKRGSLLLNVEVTILVDKLAYSAKKRETTDKIEVSYQSPNLSEDLAKEAFISDHSDFTFVSRQNDKVPAFRLVLASRSPVFRALLANTRCKEVENGKLTMEEVGTRTLTAFWTFLLSDIIEIGEKVKVNAKDEVKEDEVKMLKEDTEVEVVRNLLILADKYDVTSLRVTAGAWLATNLTPENVLGTLEVTSRVGADEVTNVSVEFIVRNRGSKSLTLEAISASDLPKEVYLTIMNALW